MTKKKTVVIGGGWAGCAAALTAEKAGADVTLLERTDMLLGTCLLYTSSSKLALFIIDYYLGIQHPGKLLFCTAP